MTCSPPLSFGLSVLALSASINFSLAQQADGCPFGSKPKRVVGTETQCVCDQEAGFVFYNARCQDRASVRDQLYVRTVSIGRSIQSTVEAINAEKNTRYLQLIRDQIPNMAGTAIALAVTKDAKALLPVMGALSLELLKVSDDMKDCSASENLRTNCNNLKNFQKMLEQTSSELEKVSK